MKELKKRVRVLKEIIQKKNKKMSILKDIVQSLKENKLVTETEHDLLEQNFEGVSKQIVHNQIYNSRVASSVSTVCEVYLIKTKRWFDISFSSCSENCQSNRSFVQERVLWMMKAINFQKNISLKVLKGHFLSSLAPPYSAILKVISLIIH